MAAQLGADDSRLIPDSGGGQGFWSELAASYESHAHVPCVRARLLSCRKTARNDWALVAAEKLLERSNFLTTNSAGAKAQLILLALSARLKSCPVTKLLLPAPR